MVLSQWHRTLLNDTDLKRCMGQHKQSCAATGCRLTTCRHAEAHAWACPRCRNAFGRSNPRGRSCRSTSPTDTGPRSAGLALRLVEAVRRGLDTPTPRGRAASTTMHWSAHSRQHLALQRGESLILIGKSDSHRQRPADCFLPFRQVRNGGSLPRSPVIAVLPWPALQAPRARPGPGRNPGDRALRRRPEGISFRSPCLRVSCRSRTTSPTQARVRDDRVICFGI